MHIIKAMLIAGTIVGITATVLPVRSPAQTVIRHQNPQRIKFAANATSAEFQNTNSYSPSRYVLTGKAGQFMEIALNAENPISLTVTDAVGNLLGSILNNAAWSKFLPATQDYYITVNRPRGTSYDLYITIPQRVQFAPGATSFVQSGVIPPNSSHTYLVDARAGQKMSVNVDSPTVGALTIVGLDGTPLVNSNMHETSNWSGRLPITQGYKVQVNNRSSARLKYTTTIAIR